MAPPVVEVMDDPEVPVGLNVVAVDGPLDRGVEQFGDDDQQQGREHAGRGHGLDRQNDRKGSEQDKAREGESRIKAREGKLRR